MALKPIVVHNVQLFVRVRGKLAAGSLVACKGPDNACRGREGPGRPDDRRDRLHPHGRGSGLRRWLEPVTLVIFGEVTPAALCSVERPALSKSARAGGASKEVDSMCERKAASAD
jgi:hypothetical protein